MGQVLHGSATTTEAVRRAIQHSQESLKALARRHGVNPKTIAKWKKRRATADLPTGPKDPRSTSLSIEDEAVVVTFRVTRCCRSMTASTPYRRRSRISRDRLASPLPSAHGISRLPDVEGDKPNRRKFKSYPIGYFHIDIAEVRTEQGRLYLFVAIDRTSKFAFVELHEKATTRVSGDFLRHLIAAVPYKVHTVLTDNGIHFTTPGAGGSAAPLIKQAIANGERFRAQAGRAQPRCGGFARSRNQPGAAIRRKR